MEGRWPIFLNLLFEFESKKRIMMAHSNMKQVWYVQKASFTTDFV